MIQVRPPGAGSSRCTVRTVKSPPSISSVNSSPGVISARRIRIGSSPGGVIVNVVPAANGPSISIFSMPSFHCGHRAISDHRRQTASGAALVWMLCSYSHMIPPYLDYAKTNCVQTICQQTMLPAEVKTTSLQRVTGVGGGQAPRTPGRLSGGRTQITPLGEVLPRHARPRLSVQIGGYLRIAADQRWSQTVIRFQA